MKVITTNASNKYQVKIKEFHRIVAPGVIFDVTPERFHHLHGGNKYAANFVEPYNDATVTSEEATTEDISKAKKKHAEVVSDTVENA